MENLNVAAKLVKKCLFCVSRNLTDGMHIRLLICFGEVPIAQCFLVKFRLRLSTMARRFCYMANVHLLTPNV